MSVLETMMELGSRPTVEVRQPKPGLRHNKSEMLVHHRFPVKNGISQNQVMVRIIEKNNALLSMMIKSGKVKSHEEVVQERYFRRRMRGLRT